MQIDAEQNIMTKQPKSIEIRMESNILRVYVKFIRSWDDMLAESTLSVHSCNRNGSYQTVSLPAWRRQQPQILQEYRENELIIDQIELLLNTCPYDQIELQSNYW